jgi:adenylylsulfate kinase-like enzyme
LKNFTGIDSPYEPPDDAEVHLRADRMSLEQCVETLLVNLG